MIPWRILNGGELGMRAAQLIGWCLAGCAGVQYMLDGRDHILHEAGTTELVAQLMSHARDGMLLTSGNHLEGHRHREVHLPQIRDIMYECKRITRVHEADGGRVSGNQNRCMA